MTTSPEGRLGACLCPRCGLLDGVPDGPILYVQVCDRCLPAAILAAQMDRADSRAQREREDRVADRRSYAKLFEAARRREFAKRMRLRDAALRILNRPGAQQVLL